MTNIQSGRDSNPVPLEKGRLFAGCEWPLCLSPTDLPKEVNKNPSRHKPTRNDEQVVLQCWAYITDGGPALKHPCLYQMWHCNNRHRRWISLLARMWFFQARENRTLLETIPSPSKLKLHTLLNISSGNILRNLCTFISKIMKSFSSKCNEMITLYAFTWRFSTS